MPPHIYEHTVNPSALSNLLTHLLPKTLSITSKLNNHPRTPHLLVLTTFPQSTTVLPPPPYAVSLFDRQSPDLHQATLFSSLELHSDPPTDKEMAQLLALLTNFKRQRPNSGARTPWHEVAPQLFSTADESAEGADLIFAGGVNGRTASALRIHPLLGAEKVARDDIFGPGGPYVKLAFRSPPRAALELPEGLEWSAVKTADDVSAVMDNNALVRLRSQIDGRTNVAVRDVSTGKLVAWGYLGLDGSVKTLFVRPEWRRRGLARRVVRKLTAAGGPHGWGHADVGASNTESNALFRSFDAEGLHDCFWMWLDLRAATRIVVDRPPNSTTPS